MPLVINTNVASLNSQRQLMNSGNALDRASERLSSGQRINSAKDDAAGLAISNRMTSQIRGLDQAIRNANDGVSLIQTAEGALQESTNILQRMRELSIQSANGIYSDADRKTLDAEVQQLIQELDRIATSTSFNGQKLLDGSLGKVNLQVGSDAGQTITMKIPAMDAKTLGMGFVGVDMLGGEIDLSTLAINENDILINGQSIAKSLESYQGFAIVGPPAVPAQTMDKLIDLINKNVLGIDASTYAQATATGAGTGVLENGQVFEVAITKLDGTVTTVQVTNTQNLNQLAEKINTESGGLLNAIVGDNSKLSIAGINVASFTITDGSVPANAAGGGIAGTYAGRLVLESEHGDPITITRGSTGTLAQLNALGFRENTNPGNIEGIGMATPAVPWNVGDLTINGVAISNKNTDSLAGKVAAINAAQNDTGVTAAAFSSATLDFAAATLSTLAGPFDLNGVTIDLGAASATRTISEVVALFNASTDATGISASLLGTRVVLEGSTSSITFRDGAAGSVATALGGALLAHSDFVNNPTPAAVADGNSVNGGIKLSSTNGAPISIKLGANADPDTLGILESNVTAEGAFGTAIASISIDTAAGAQKALGVIDNALTTINDARSQLGAINNRLDFTMSNLANVSEKTSASRSRIVDADFAAETAALSRAQVLQQAAQAMLAQSNARPEQVLQLLR
ncbi:flagellin N-terminal helical domain-containing protein [Cellvibrio sp. OA-2007]|uniref:flagellin N-terminal helical domain-containing protein n=1 Tax=Cellvibrio sp. OA-2007 TaxID=529823 RepID=UPI0007866837|nr:flagellin [Cellvibrio sp. OA-2007]